MSRDYKNDIQILAEDLAQEQYERGFYELTDDQQYEVYTRAGEQYWDRACSVD